MKVKRRTLFKLVWFAIAFLTVFSTIAFTVGMGR
jgi:hypothetical protein